MNLGFDDKTTTSATTEMLVIAAMLQWLLYKDRSPKYLYETEWKNASQLRMAGLTAETQRHSSSASNALTLPDLSRSYNQLSVAETFQNANDDTFSMNNMFDVRGAPMADQASAHQLAAVW